MMMWSREKFKVLVIFAIAVQLLPASAIAAAPKGAVTLSGNKLFQVSKNGKRFTCGNLPPWSPGRLIGRKFYPAKVELAALKAKAKRAASRKAKATLSKKIKSVSAYAASGKAVCRGGKPISPTPIPTAPPSGGGFFDSAGRVTAAGKAAFGIPSNFNASVNAGITAWRSTCAGCHGSSVGAIRINQFSAIKTRVQLSPMSFSIPAELSEQQLADITAYANF